MKFLANGAPVVYARSPAGVDAATQREVIDAVGALNRHFAEVVDDPEIEARTRQYEMAYRMQASVPELMDLSDEPPGILEMYGTRGGDGTFASNCLVARRLAERGVRCVQVYHRAWDHHGQIERNMRITAREVDRAHIRGFSVWLAGGGIKPGITHGATDDLGCNAVEDVVEVHDLHDLHATILHLFGIDHQALTYRYQGRDFRLTDVGGRVVEGILA